jgi:hypothetical protein
MFDVRFHFLSLLSNKGIILFCREPKLVCFAMTWHKLKSEEKYGHEIMLMVEMIINWLIYPGWSGLRSSVK